MTYIGDAIPDFTYGITLTAAYKGLDLTIFGTGSQGNDIFHCYYRPDYKTSNRLKEVWYDNHWSANNPTGTKPLANANNIDQYIQSDAMVYDASFFRIKQIQLGYTLPKSLLRKCLSITCAFIVHSMILSLSLNIPVSTQKSSANATTGMGIDMGGYPASKKVVLGFNIEF